MSDGDIPSILALLALLFLSAFFSGSETALIGARRVRLQAEAERGSKTAALALKLLEKPGSLLGTILVGNNLVNVAAAAIGATLLGPVKATLVITLLLLLFGEIPPKTIAALWPEKMVRLVAYPVFIAKILLRPLAWITETISDIMIYPLTRKLKPRRSVYSEDELQTALDQSQHAGELEPGEAVMAQEILDLDETTIREIMIPLEDAAFLERDWSLERILEEIRRTRFTRYPVYLSGTQHPCGIIHIKDLMIHKNVKRWQNLIRILPLRPATMNADDLLRDMQIARFHMAAVTDPDKRVIGFVTMETILEEIVGEIADEHDREADPIRNVELGIYCVRGDLEVADVSRILNVELPAEDPEQTIEDFYRGSIGSSPASGLQLGRTLIRHGKTGYIITLFEEMENGNGDDQTNRNSEDAV